MMLQMLKINNWNNSSKENIAISNITGAHKSRRHKQSKKTNAGSNKISGCKQEEVIVVITPTIYLEIIAVDPFVS